MFTGIIQQIGTLKTLQLSATHAVATITSNYQNLQLGESIAINGICLTVASFENSVLTVAISQETLQRTTAKNWSVRQQLNLERSLTPNTLMGGHLVTGHIDGVSIISNIEQLAEFHNFELQVPQQLLPYIAVKGSICIDGISLTVNAVRGDCMQLTIIPHTFNNTNLSSLTINSQVNVEVDLIARYVGNYMQQTTQTTG